MANKSTENSQKRAVAALLTSPTIQSAAQTAKVGHRTIHTWLHKDVDFQSALREAQDAAINQAVSRLAGAAGGAAHVLATIAHDKNEKSTIRVSAARALLDTTLRMLEMRDLAGRVAELERVLTIER